MWPIACDRLNYSLCGSLLGLTRGKQENNAGEKLCTQNMRFNHLKFSVLGNVWKNSSCSESPGCQEKMERWMSCWSFQTEKTNEIWLRCTLFNKRDQMKSKSSKKWKFFVMQKRRLNVQPMICTNVETNETFGRNLSWRNSWITRKSCLKVQFNQIITYIH